MTESELEISSLPIEILLKIFSFLDKSVLITCVANVCTQWNQLAWDPQLWQSLTINGTQLSLVGVCSFIDKSPLIRKLQIFERGDAGYILNHFLKTENYRKIEYLTLKQCHDYLDGHLLIQMVQKCPKLKYINLKDTQFFGKEIYKELGILNNLKCLNLGLNYSFKIFDLEILTNFCQHLEELSILSTSLYDSSDSQSINKIFQSSCEKLSPRIKVLKLNAYGLDNLSIKVIGNCTKLVVLHLHRAVKITRDSMKYLSELTLIENLLISKGERIKSDGWHNLFKHGKFNLIDSLFLMRNRYLDDYTMFLIQLRCPLIKRISILNCRSVTGVGVTYLIQECRCLKYLNVDGTHPSVGKTLKDPLHSVGKLEKIVVGTFVLDITKYHEFNPNLKILRNIHEDKCEFKRRRVNHYLEIL